MTPGAVLHVYISAPHGRVHFILPPPPHRGHQKFQGEGGPRGGNFHGGGVTFFDVFFFRDFEARIIVFIDDLTSLTVG